jgi:hypothetical protein
MSTPKQLSFQKMFTSWFDNIVATYDVQEKQDLDWDWEEEILKFIKDPETEYLFMEAEAKEKEEFIAKEMKEEKEEYFTNSFGIKMKRSN